MICHLTVYTQLLPYLTVSHSNQCWHCPGTTKKLHQYSLPLLIMVTLHIPICGMCELLYVLNTIFATDLFSSVIFVLVHSDGCEVIITSSIYFSICMFHFFTALLLFVLGFAVITDLMQWKLKIFNLSAATFLVSSSALSVS